MSDGQATVMGTQGKCHAQLRTKIALGVFEETVWTQPRKCIFAHFWVIVAQAPA